MSAVIQEEDDNNALVTAFATTQSKAKEPKVIPEAIPKSSSIVPPLTVQPPKKNPAYTYELKAILLDALKVVKQKILDAIILGIMVAELMSLSPELQKKTMEHCKTQRVLVAAPTDLSPFTLVSVLMRPVHIEHVNPLRELKVMVNGMKEEFELLDGGSEIVIMREDL